MDARLDKALLTAIHAIAERFGPSAVVKGGMALRLQGIPRSTMDVDFCFQPYRHKTPFTEELVLLMQDLCEGDLSVHSDSKKLRIAGRLEGADIVVEASPHEAFEPDTLPTHVLARAVNLQPCVVSIMPNPMAFAHKLGTWLDRRLSRDLYDIYVFYDVLRSAPDAKILLNRIRHPNYAHGVKPQPHLDTIQAFLDFLRSECSKVGAAQIEEDLMGVVDERERAGIGGLIQTTIRRMSRGGGDAESAH